MLGWLHSSPPSAKGQKRKTRFEQLYSVDNPPEMPEVDSDLLIGYMHSCGWYSIGAAGVIPITWVELKAWAECTRRWVEPIEFEIMSEMSQAYVSELNAASEDKNLPPPYAAGTSKRDYVAKKASLIL